MNRVFINILLDKSSEVPQILSLQADYLINPLLSYSLF
jgi:hypothetical protein